MTHVFISYNRSQSDIMLRVKSAIEAAGVPVWIDRSAAPGAAWRKNIEQMLLAASHVVVLLSPEVRQGGWVESEALTAHEHQKTIIPVIVKGTRAEVMFMPLNLYEWVDLVQDYDAELVRLVATVGGAAPADSAEQALDEAYEPELSVKVRRLADQGRKIEAIKVHRAQHGLSLSDAKQAVEAYLNQRAPGGGADEFSDEFSPEDERAADKIEPGEEASLQWKLAATVLNWYPHVGAAGLELKQSIRLGDLLQFGDETNGFQQRVDSIQIERVPVAEAKRHQQIGLRVDRVPQIGESVRKAVNARAAFTVGTVKSYSKKSKLATIELIDELKVDDEIEFRAGDNYFCQRVTSMHVNGQYRESAGNGDSIRIPVVQPVQADDFVYRLI